MKGLATRISETALMVAIFLSVALLPVFDLKDFDTFWHLANGREMLREGRLIQEEIFSYTAVGNVFDNHEWMSQALMSLAYEAGGPPGLIAMKSLVLALAALLFFKSARFAGAPPLLAAALVLAAWISGLHRFTARPQVFSFLFMGWLAFVLTGVKHGRLSRSMLFSLPVLMVMWDMFHGAVYGIVFLGAFTAGEAAYDLVRKDGKGFSPLLIKVSLACAFLMLLSPFGITTYGGLMEYSKVNYMAELTEEFQPTKPGEFPVFWLLLGLCAALAALTRKEASLTYSVLIVPFAALALRFNRATAAFSLAAIPALAHYMSVMHLRLRGRLGLAARALVALAAIVMVLFVVRMKTSDPEMKLGAGINKTYIPTSSVDFLQGAHIPGNIYNPGNTGGYLAWRMYPGKKIFLYNHHTLFEDVFAKTQGKRFLDDYKVTHALVMYGDLWTSLLFDPREWVPVFWDDLYAVLVRDIPENKEFLDANALKWCTPGRGVAELNRLVAGGAPAIEAASDCLRLLKHTGNPALAGLVGGLLLEYGGGDRGAALTGEVEQALRANPGSPSLLAALGSLTYSGGGDLRQAREYMTKALEKDPSLTKAALVLGYMHLDTAMPAEAAEMFTLLVRADEETASALYGRSLALERMGEHSAAAEDLRRFLQLSPGGQWAALARQRLSGLGRP